MTNWSDLAGRFGPLVWRTAYRLLGSEAEAADCFQETFLAAVVVCRREEVRNWAGLFRRLAVTRALDRLRRRGRESRRVEHVEQWGLVPGGHPDPAEQAQAAELAALLRRAVGRLPRRQAEVFCLRCLEELSYEQIGSQMNLRANAVGVLLHRARRRLHELLAPAAAQQEAERQP
ncbi:MAG TPA: sigma-70 family RNA polymerase sigma factor [Phycisphaerae bacterium]|nr:sigma-70 family RNA polymerase sigma factor [Phycisphaerae bacterium]